MITSENIKILFDFMFVNNATLQEEYQFYSETDQGLNSPSDNY